MKKIINLVLLLCVYLTVYAYDDDKYYDKVETIISNLKNYDTPNTKVEYKFYLYDAESNIVEWYILVYQDLPNINRPRFIYGINNTEKKSTLLESSRAELLLSEVTQAELFNLPKFAQSKAFEKSIYGGTGIKFLYALRKEGSDVVKIFRLMGASYPAEKVQDALIATANSSN